MRGAWQPQGHSTHAHLLLPSPPLAWLLQRCPDLVSSSQRCCTGHWDTHSGEHTQVLSSCVAPSQVAMKCFPRCHLCLPAGMRQGNLLDAACVIWAVGDPVVGFLHPLPISPWRCWKSPSTSGQENALQRATVTLSLFLCRENNRHNAMWLGWNLVISQKVRCLLLKH